MFEVGDLVELYGRLVRIEWVGTQEVGVTRVGYGNSDSVRLSTVEEEASLITRVARRAEDKQPSLVDRRALLLGMVQRLSRDSAVDSPAYRAFWALKSLVTPMSACDCLPCVGAHRRDDPNFAERWFWGTVALSVDTPSHVSYAATREVADDNDRRRHCSMHKFLSGAARLHGLELTPEELHAAANAWGQNSSHSYSYSFEVVTGDDLVKAYEGSPEQWNSCMSGSRSHLTRWYAENPDRVNLLKVSRGGVFVGRALLWTCDGGQVVLDRFYPTDQGPEYRAVCSYAESHEWRNREADDLHGLTVTMRPSFSGCYPYVDTFYFTDHNPQASTPLVLTAHGSGSIRFRSTSGLWDGVEEEEEEEDTETCYRCDQRIHADDTSWVEDESYCQSCYDEVFVWLSYRSSGGRGRVEREALREDCRECDECDEWRLSEHVEEATGAQGNTLEVCHLCREDDYTTCDNCEEWVHGNRVTHLSHEEVTYCDECRDDLTQECSACHEYRPKELCSDTPLGACCENCMEECSLCGRTTHPEEICCLCPALLIVGQPALPECVIA